MQALKFLMLNCGFRQVYLREFEFAYKLIDNLIQALKYRCYDLYRHLVILLLCRSSSLGLILGSLRWDGSCPCLAMLFHFLTCIWCWIFSLRGAGKDSLKSWYRCFCILGQSFCKHMTKQNLWSYCVHRALRIRTCLGNK